MILKTPINDDLQKLLTTRKQPCVSIYMPTHRKGMEIKQDPIRFKNMLKKTEKLLEEKGFHKSEIDDLKRPVNRLLDDSFTWRYMSEGLAVFLCPEESCFYKIPFQVDKKVVVSNRFYIKPLVPLLGGDIRYYILALNLGNVKLYRASGFGIKKIETDELLDNIDKVLKYDDPERQIQFHTGTGPGKGRRAAMFHGQGVGTDDARAKKDILRFFQAVDKGVMSVLNGETAPLLLAGPDHLVSIYKKANSYAHLMDRYISGNPLDLDEQELHRLSWSTAQPYFQTEQDNALDLYHQLLQKNRASHDIKQIVRAGFQDRIRYLFVDINVNIGGRYHKETGDVELFDYSGDGGQDLLDLVTVQTLLHNGKVYTLDPGNIPGGQPAAAVFRF